MDQAIASAYLDRIALPRTDQSDWPGQLDAEALRRLHRAHLLAVPFENLAQHLDDVVSLAEPDLIDKIVRRRRGGFCYELNGAFGLLLEALGAQVTLLGARVHRDGGFGPPLDHLALLVRLPDGSGPWLVDVGFGDHSVYPLLAGSRVDQDDPEGRFTVLDADPDPDPDSGAGPGAINVFKDGELQYQLEPVERSLSDFGPTCWWQQTSPESGFARRTVCSRLTDNGRITLSDRVLIITADGVRYERELDGDAAVLEAYQEHFGLTLGRVPETALGPARAGIDRAGIERAGIERAG
jgi:N-hydroxyarylamine O-acetyltransferase